MRILAEAGLVTEAPELARDRRERWWQRVPGNLRWVTPTGHAAPAPGPDPARLGGR